MDCELSDIIRRLDNSSDDEQMLIVSESAPVFALFVQYTNKNTASLGGDVSILCGNEQSVLYISAVIGEDAISDIVHLAKDFYAYELFSASQKFPADETDIFQIKLDSAELSLRQRVEWICSKLPHIFNKGIALDS